MGIVQSGQIQKQDKHQQEHSRGDAGNTGAAAGFHIDHGLSDHGTAAHAAKKTGDDIGRALGYTFLRRPTTLIGHIANQIKG